MSSSGRPVCSCPLISSMTIVTSPAANAPAFDPSFPTDETSSGSAMSASVNRKWCDVEVGVLAEVGDVWLLTDAILSCGGWDLLGKLGLGRVDLGC